MSFGSYSYGSSSYGGLPETIIDYEYPVKLNVILRSVYKLDLILRQPFKIDINLR